MPLRKSTHWAWAAIVAVATPMSAAASLIPRALLFADPAQSAATLSPDGRWIAYLAPSNGVQNIWVRPAEGHGAARLLTHDSVRGIHNVRWSADGHYLLYFQDSRGEENDHLYRLDLAGRATDLTPFPGVQARLVALPPDDRGRVIIALNRADRQWHDVYRVDLSSGSLALDTRNPGNADSFYATDAGQVLLASRTRQDGGTEILIRDNEASPWRVQRIWPERDGLRAIYRLDRAGLYYYVAASVGGDAVHLLKIDRRSGAMATVAKNGPFDLDALSANPKTGRPDLVRFGQDREEWHALTRKAGIALSAPQSDVLRRHRQPAADPH